MEMQGSPQDAAEPAAAASRTLVTGRNSRSLRPNAEAPLTPRGSGASYVGELNEVKSEG
jgi:hypothetical protein